MLAKDLVVLTKAGHSEPSLILVPKGKSHPMDFLREIVLDFVETAEGVQAVLNTSDDFNWNDAFNNIPDAFWNSYGVAFFDGTEVLLSGNVIEEIVDADERLLDDSRHIVVKEFENVTIIKQFANDEDGVYGDIYIQKWHAKLNHQGENILEGFGIMDNATGYLVESTRDWYNTLEEAELDIPKNEKEVVDLTKFSGQELFNLVFPEPESPDYYDYATEEEYEKAYAVYEDAYEAYDQLHSSVYEIEEHPEVSDFETVNTDRDEWWEETTYQFKKGEHYFEIVEKSHVMTADSDILFNTFRIVK